MAKLVENKFIFAKIEPSNQGGTGAFVAADSIHVVDPSFAFSDTQTIDFKPFNGAFTPTEQIVVGKLAEISFDTYMRGSGTAGDVPNHAVLYRMAGFTETITPGTSVVYSDANSNFESGEMLYNLDGLEFKLNGCIATYEGKSEAATGSKESWTIKGHITSVEDAAPISGAVYPDIDPIAVCGVTATLTKISDASTTNPIFANLSFNMGNEIVTPLSISSTDCFGNIVIADRQPEMSYDPEVTSKAANDLYGDWTTGEKFDLDTGVIGANPGNQVQIELSGIRYREYSEGDRDKVAIYEVPASFTNISITYT